jgi:hypothetical protein
MKQASEPPESTTPATPPPRCCLSQASASASSSRSRATLSSAKPSATPTSLPPSARTPPIECPRHCGPHKRTLRLRSQPQRELQLVMIMKSAVRRKPQVSTVKASGAGGDRTHDRRIMSPRQAVHERSGQPLTWAYERSRHQENPGELQLKLQLRPSVPTAGRGLVIRGFQEDRAMPTRRRREIRTAQVAKSRAQEPHGRVHDHVPAR